MILRPSSDSNSLPDLDTMRTEIVSNTTKPDYSLEGCKDYSKASIDEHIKHYYKRGWQSNFKHHSIKMVIKTEFDSLNDFMLKSKHSNKYVTKLIYNIEKDSFRTAEINGFKNMVTIMRDYNYCLEGLAEYLSLPNEDIVELVEDRADSTRYTKEAICYVLMNDCVKEEGLLDYSAAKLSALRDSMNHFCIKYEYEMDYVMDQVNNAI